MSTVNTSGTTSRLGSAADTHAAGSGAAGAHAAVQAPGPAHTSLAGPLTFRRVVASEVVKLRTIRSTVWALVAGMLSVLLLGAFTAVGVIVQEAPADGALDASRTDPTGGAIAGVSLAMYAILALGVIAVGSEYASGSIKVSVTAVPRRALLVWGKAAAVGAVTLVATPVTSLVTFFVARAIVATDGVSISLATPGVARAVVGSALYLAVIAVLGVGTGWLLRSTAGSVAALVAVLVFVPGIASALPQDIADRVMPYLPSNAGTAILQLAPTGQLAPWTGFALFCGYAVLLLVAASRVVQRRDA